MNLPVYKYVPLIFLAVFSANAKVAYIPVSENFLTNPFYPDTRRIFVVDLELGQVIKKMDIGNGVGAVFVSNDSSKVYAGVEYENKIVEIDAKTLSVSKSWIDLPIEPTFLILNPANDSVLFMGEYNSNIYKIDLTTDIISEVFSGLSSSYRSYAYTEDLAYFSIYELLNEQLTVFNLADMSVHSQVTNVGHIFQYSLSQSGNEVYFYDIDDEIFYAKYTNDGSVKWAHTPIDASPNIFIPSVNADGSLFAASWNQSYEFQTDSGSVSVLSDRGVSDYYNLGWYEFESTGKNEKIAVSQAEVFCLTGWCWVVGDLTVRSVDFNTGTDTLLYVNDLSGSGSRAVGRFLGDLLYKAPMVSVFSNRVSIVLYLILIWLVAAYFYRRTLVVK